MRRNCEDKGTIALHKWINKSHPKSKTTEPLASRRIATKTSSSSFCFFLNNLSFVLSLSSFLEFELLWAFLLMTAAVVLSDIWNSYKKETYSFVRQIATDNENIKWKEKYSMLRKYAHNFLISSSQTNTKKCSKLWKINSNVEINVERIVVWPRRFLGHFLKELFDIHNVFEFMPISTANEVAYFFQWHFFPRMRCSCGGAFFAFEKFTKA